MPVAASHRSNFTLDIPHVTTSNFMEFGVSFAKEYVPGSNWDLSQETFMRLEPMPVPTFGEAEVKHRAFFVPFRTVFPAFLDFSEGVPHVFNNGESSIPQFVPVLYDSDITFMFVQNDLVTQLSEEDANNPDIKYDFALDISVQPNVENIRKYNLTPLGRRVYKMFVSLGMKFTFSYTTRSFVSALPLFCAARIYLDWFYTSQYAHTSGYTVIQKYLIKNDDVVDIGESFVPGDDLYKICVTLSTIFYEPDYFTAAWDKPTGPNTGLQSSITIPDIGTESGPSQSIAQNGYDSTDFSLPAITSGNIGAAPAGISSYILTAVKKLADYCKRNQFAGARALDRFYARFGIQIPAESLNRSYLVGEFSHYIQFGDVTSMASTESATLGDYAGKGVTFGNGNFQFSGKERGYFIVITSIIPKTYYYQGRDRLTQHVSKLDFWTEEFDGLGVQALSKAEVYKPQDGLTDYLLSDDYDNQVFGFVPRYAEYKTSSAILSGDYILRSRNVGKDAWTLFRNVRTNHGDPIDEFIHDISFVNSIDSNQYNRIFYNTSENADHFNVIHQFRLKVSFPGKSLYDTYEFDNEENSRRVEMGIGGTQLN